MIYAIDSAVLDLLPFSAKLECPISTEDLTSELECFLQGPDHEVAACRLDEQIAGFVAWSKSKLFASNVARFQINKPAATTRHRGTCMRGELMNVVETLQEKRLSHR